MAVMTDVACFGEILWDLFETSPGMFRREIGGALANVAVGLTRLGIRASVIGGIGRDRFGDALVAELSGAGVDLQYAPRLVQRTGLAFVSQMPTGEPSFLFYRHQTADMMLSASDLHPNASAARFGVIGSSTLLTPRLRSATSAFVRRLQTQGGALLIDLNVRAHLWPSRNEMISRLERMLPHAQLIKASDADLAALPGGLPRLRRGAPKAVILITRGASQTTVMGAFGHLEVPTKPRLVVDATGAGDAFCAGVLATLVRSKVAPASATWKHTAFWAHAVHHGHLMAKKAISCKGAVRGVVNLGSIIRLLDTRRKNS